MTDTIEIGFHVPSETPPVLGPINRLVTTQLREIEANATQTASQLVKRSKVVMCAMLRDLGACGCDDKECPICHH